MRAFAFASAISLALAGGAEAAPRRVASLNLCTDELLLVLGDPRQIVSVTHLAQEPAETPLWRQARNYRRNDGSCRARASHGQPTLSRHGSGRLSPRWGCPSRGCCLGSGVGTESGEANDGEKDHRRPPA